MSKPWEIELTKDQSYKFVKVLKGLKKNGLSPICPFKPSICNRSKPPCNSFVKGLKRVSSSSKAVCPCFRFRTASLIWRIERLLKYNKLFIRHKHISIHSIPKGRNKDAI